MSATPPPHAPPPSSAGNGWAVAALVLGIVCLALSPVPILNQLGILVGIVGLGIGVAAVLVGRRRRARVAMAVVGLVLSVLGLVASFAFTSVYVAALDEAFAPVASVPSGMLPVAGGGYLPVGPATPSGPVTFELELTSPDASSTSAPTWTNESGGLEQQTTASLPFRKTVTVDPSDPTAYVSVGGSTPIQGKGRTIACTVKRDGVVVSQDRQTGEYASVTCQASPSGP